MNTRILAALLALVVCPPAGADGGCGTLASLDWLLGEWTAEGDKTVFRESWTRVSEASFEGAGVERSKADGSVQGAEALRLLEMAGGVYYVSKVSHNELPIAFRLSECGGGRFAFVNPDHDFPRRLDYERGGDDRLSVRVSDGAKKGFTLAFLREPAATGPQAGLLAAEDARFAAMIAADPAGMNRWLAVDLQYAHSTGQVSTRDELIDDIASGRIRYLAVEPGERLASFLDESAAIVQGPAHMRVLAEGTPLEFDIRYLAVYVLQEGVWQLHAWQSLQLP